MKDKIINWLKTNRMSDDTKTRMIVSDIIHDFIQDLGLDRQWVSVSGYKELPLGDWLVELEGEKLLQTCRRRSNVAIIGGHFAFDMPRVISYQPLPPSPTEDKA